MKKFSEWPPWIHWLIIIGVLLFFIIFNLMDDREPRLGRPVEITSADLERVQRFRIQGVESSNEWIELNDGGQISIVGFLGGGIGGVTYHDSGLELSSLFVPETIEDITVYHVIPFFRSAGTEEAFVFPEDSVGKIESKILPIVESSSPTTLLIRLDGTIRGEWIHADSITKYRGLDYQNSVNIQLLWRDGSPKANAIRRDFDAADSEGQFWLDISDGETSSLFGSSSSWGLYLGVPARLGPTAIYHFIGMRSLTQVDVEPGANFIIYVTMVDGELWASPSP